MGLWMSKNWISLTKTQTMTMVDNSPKTRYLECYYQVGLGRHPYKPQVSGSNGNQAEAMSNPKR